MTNKENNVVFDTIDKQEMTLVQERVAWQAQHPKPWYLKQQQKQNKYYKQ